MLTIVITPSRLYFRDLTDELQQAIIMRYDLKSSDKGFYIQAEPGTLYKILLKLAYDYDIELV